MTNFRVYVWLILLSWLAAYGCKGADSVSSMPNQANVAEIDAAPVPSQTPRSTEVQQIDEYCESFDSIAGKDSKPHRIFADISQTERPHWQEFGSEEKLARYREKNETYTIAYNWLKDSRVVISTTTIFSGSGDWVKYVNSCYREDGTIARANIEYRTFYGHFFMLHEIYFRPDGTVFSESREYRDLESEKIYQPSSDDIEDNTMMNTVEYYTATKKLPYAKFLRGK